jgi:hypothetical protein
MVDGGGHLLCHLQGVSSKIEAVDSNEPEQRCTASISRSKAHRLDPSSFPSLCLAERGQPGVHRGGREIRRCQWAHWAPGMKWEWQQTE